MCMLKYKPLYKLWYKKCVRSTSDKVIFYSKKCVGSTPDKYRTLV